MSDRQQSPVAIPADAPVHRDGIAPDYRPLRVEITDDGYIVRIDCDHRGSVGLDGRRYALRQFHFHAPSEHTVAGISYPVALHLVHEDRGGRLAVIGVMLTAGRANPALDAIVAALGGAGGGSLDPGELLPTDLRHVSYTGSLTTPPYTTGVAWRVCLTPLEASTEQLRTIGGTHIGNIRALQPLTDRAFE